MYNWRVQTGPSPKETMYLDITHTVKANDSAKCHKHHLDDCAALSELGRMVIKTKPQLQCYKLQFACCRMPSVNYKGPKSRRMNCQPACKFQGEGDCSCFYSTQVHHQCTARLKITRTLQNAHDGVVVITFMNDRVPGTIPRPVPFSGGEI